MVMASGIKGEVVLEATVDSRGKVGQVRVVKTQPMLTQAAVDAVRQSGIRIRPPWTAAPC